MRSRVVDRHFPGIGRVKKASGTSDAKTHTAINAMLTMLVRKGRLDLVRAWADGVIHIMDLYDRYRTEKLDHLPSAETMRPLWSSGERVGVMEGWAASVTGKHSFNSVRQTVHALKALPQKAGLTLADLPALVAEYQKRCAKAGFATSFGNTRSNVRAFLRDTVGVDHPLYAAVRRIDTLPRDRRPGQPFTRSTLPTFLGAMHAHGPIYGRMAESLALSGMRPTEYWGNWHWVSDTEAKVQTAKQRHGKVLYRRVPLIRPIIKPTVARRTFEDHMRMVTREHAVYDLRRTFMHLMEQARIPRSRRMYYMGHAASDVSSLYEEHEVDEYLTIDRERLSSYLTHPITHDDADVS